MLVAVAVLLIILSGFHSIAGERLILGRIEIQALPKIWGSHQATFRTIQATWHFVSALWLGLALQFLVMHFYPGYMFKAVLITFGVIFAFFTILPLIWSSGKHKSWIAFGLMSVLLLAKAFL